MAKTKINPVLFVSTQAIFQATLPYQLCHFQQSWPSRQEVGQWGIMNKYSVSKNYMCLNILLQK